MSEGRVRGAGGRTRTGTTKGQEILSLRRLPFRHARL